MINADIQVEEYVRLARNQGINKIISSEDDFYILDEDIADEFGYSTSILYKNQISEEITKHSSNLIDLIEVGDYVNGNKVVKKYNDYLMVGTDFINQGIPNELIETIVTKEQFKSMEYKVGGEDDKC